MLTASVYGNCGIANMVADFADQIVNRIAVRRVLCVGQAAVSQDVLVGHTLNAVRAIRHCCAPN
jgi:hypothetical protein